MRIGLDIHHRNKGRGSTDKGAAGDLDADGDIERDENEDAIVAEYFAATRPLLEAAGCEVIDGFSGSYPERHQHANRLGVGLYLAGHINAGGGDYGLIGVDHRSAPGSTSRKVAAQLQVEWSRRLGFSVRVQDVRPGDWTAHAFNTIGGVHAGALCLEPLFIDGHRHLLAPSRRAQTIAHIAHGIAAAVAAVR